MSVYICMLVCQWIYINACISVDTISGHIYKKLNLGVHLWRRHLDKNKHCSISLERRNGRLSTLQMEAHTGCQGVTSTKVFSRESKRLFSVEMWLISLLSGCCCSPDTSSQRGGSFWCWSVQLLGGLCLTSTPAGERGFVDYFHFHVPINLNPANVTFGTLTNETAEAAVQEKNLGKTLG